MRPPPSLVSKHRPAKELRQRPPELPHHELVRPRYFREIRRFPADTENTLGANFDEPNEMGVAWLDRLHSLASKKGRIRYVRADHAARLAMWIRTTPSS